MELNQLKQDLVQSQAEVTRLKSAAETQQAEMTDLKVKLQKGTLALNDLHMDKNDLNDQLTALREELKTKVRHTIILII